jgi:hypothetical protein
MPQLESLQTGPKAGAAVDFAPKKGIPPGFRKRTDRPTAIAGHPVAPSRKPPRWMMKMEDRPQSLLLRPALELDQVIRIQRERTSRHEYIPVGKLKVVVFGEPALGAPVPPRDETQVWGIRLDWMGEGPLLAVSSDNQDLLITGPLHHPPRILHPAWQPQFGAHYEYIMEDGTRSLVFGDRERQAGLVVKDHIWHLADRPGPDDYIEQKYEDRSIVTWPSEAHLRRGKGYIVFSPISKVMFQNARGYGVVKGLTDEANGSKFTLLINPNRRVRGEHLPEGFFLRGRFEICQGPELKFV